MSGHCHDEHSLHDGHDHNHDHSDDITPVLQYSLYQHVDFDKVVTLNATNENDGRAVIRKTWAERLDEQPELVSDTDEQLLLHVPFVTSNLPIGAHFKLIMLLVSPGRSNCML